VKPRNAFALSVLAALSLHAIILFVPRIAGQRDPGPQAIEVTLDSPPGQGFDVSPVSPPRMGAASPPAPAAAEPHGVASAASDRAAPGSQPPDGVSESPAAAGGAGASAGTESPAAASASGVSAVAVASFGGQGGGTGAPGEATPGAAGSTTLAPRPRGEILPAYPRSAKKAGWQGVVTIRAFIDDTGRVVSAMVLTSSGHESLDLSALEAVKSARFDPAVREARPVSSLLLIPVRFQLN